MIPSQATRARVEIRIRWTLMQSTLSRRAKEKGHRVRAMGVFSAVVRIFNEIAMHARTQASNRPAKANRASHGPRVSSDTQAKVRVKKARGNPKETPKNQKCESSFILLKKIHVFFHLRFFSFFFFFACVSFHFSQKVAGGRDSSLPSSFWIFFLISSFCHFFIFHYYYFCVFLSFFTRYGRSRHQPKFSSL